MATLAALDSAVLEAIRDHTAVTDLTPTPEVRLKDRDVDIVEEADETFTPGVPNVWITPLADGPSTAFYTPRDVRRSLRYRVSLLHSGSLLTGRPIEQALISAMLALVMYGELPDTTSIYALDIGPWAIEKMNFSSFESRAVVGETTTELSSVLSIDLIGDRDALAGAPAAPRLVSASYYASLGVVQLIFDKDIAVKPVANVRDDICLARGDGLTPTQLIMTHANPGPVVLLAASDFIDDEELNVCGGANPLPWFEAPDNTTNHLFESKEGVAAANIAVQLTVIP